jgi:small-conductance mechanosensitive channel
MSHRPRRFRSDLNFSIERHLREAGIEIPFPQRDLHIRSGILRTESVYSEEEQTPENPS